MFWEIVSDVRYGLRVLRRRPALTGAAIVTLALGIGANAAIVSIVDGVLVRPLPYAEPDRLVRILAASDETDGRMLDATFTEFTTLRRDSRSFADIAAFSLVPRHLADAFGDPATIAVARVAGRAFRVLGVAPAIGRDFTAHELAGSQRVVILSHSLWRERHGGDGSIVGRTVAIDGEPFTVVGVMPRGFSYPRGAHLWRPLGPDESDDDDRELQVIARLAPGRTVEQATAEMRVVQPGARGVTLWVQSLHAGLVGDVRTPLLMFLGAVGFVLLIACANVANLQLASSAARRQEFAVRSAIGAGRSRLVRQLLAESLLLALLGGALGILLGYWVLGALVAISPPGTPRLDAVALDLRVVAIMAVVTVATGLAIGLTPALRTRESHGRDALRETNALGLAVGRQRLQRVLVAGEMAIATTVVVGAVLLMLSFQRQLTLDRGLRTQNVLLVPIDPPTRFGSAAAVLDFFGGLRARLRRLPGVEQVVTSSTSPLDPRGFRVPLGPPDGEGAHGDAQPIAYAKIVSEGFFEALGIRLLAGRTFTEFDDANARPIAVVNESFAGVMLQENTQQLERSLDTPLGSVAIVGVVGDVTPTAGVPPQPTIYLPLRQVPIGTGAILVRSAGDPTPLIPAVRALIWERDASIPLGGITTLDRAIGATVASPRFHTLTVNVFAALALLLAAVGVFGVVTYGVERRRRELGLRRALGARDATLLALVLGEGVGVAAVGIGTGLVAALGFTRIIRSLLFDVSPSEPRAYALVALLLVLVATAACFVPAHRAMRVDPMEALRYE